MKAVTHNLVLNFLLGLTTQCFSTLFSSDIVAKNEYLLKQVSVQKVLLISYH
jgi:hypothetical protein